MGQMTKHSQAQRKFMKPAPRKPRYRYEPWVVFEEYNNKGDSWPKWFNWMVYIMCLSLILMVLGTCAKALYESHPMKTSAEKSIGRPPC